VVGNAATSQLVAALQLSVGFIFVVSATAKLRDPAQLLHTVAQYKLLPASMTFPVGLALLLSETFLAIAFLSDWQSRLAAIVATVMLSSFIFAVGANLWRGRSVPCGCFGDSSEQISSRTLARLGMLLSAAIVLLLGQLGILRAQHPWGDLATPLGLLLTAENFLVAACLVVFSMWVLRTREVLEVLRVALTPHGSVSARLQRHR